MSVETPCLVEPLVEPLIEPLRDELKGNESAWRRLNLTTDPYIYLFANRGMLALGGSEAQAGQNVVYAEDQSYYGRNATQFTASRQPELESTPSGLALNLSGNNQLAFQIQAQFTGKILVATTRGSYVADIDIPAGTRVLRGLGVNLSAVTAYAPLVGFMLVESITDAEVEQAMEFFERYGARPLHDFDNISLHTIDHFWRGSLWHTSFPAIDFPQTRSMNHTFYNMKALTEFPTIGVGNVLSFVQCWRQCSSLVTFPELDLASGVNFSGAWRRCTKLEHFPPNRFDNMGKPNNGCFLNTWLGCRSLTVESVNNILKSIDASGQNAPSVKPHITIDYDETTGTPDATSVANLTSRGWQVTINRVTQ